MNRITTCLTAACLVCFLPSCKFFREKKGYPDKLDYCEYYIDPSNPTNVGDYDVTYVVDGDTIRGIVDTGADVTTVEGKHFLEREDLLPKQPIINAYDSIMQWHRLKVKELSWGNVRLYDMYVSVDDGGNRAGGDGGVVGRDVLRGSIVQFDHESNQIKLSRNEAKLKGRGQVIPARFDEADKIFVPITLPNGETLEFHLDTGFAGELRLSTKNYKGSYTFRDPLVWKVLGKRGASEVEVRSLCDITFGGKVYPNSRLLLENVGRNLLGVQFLKRFKSVTIDYINKKLYIEYPEKYTLPGVGDINFEKDTIDAVPREYMTDILQIYNTYGFEVERRNLVHTITHIEADLEAEKISLGDTLVGVNNKLFYLKYLKDLEGKSKVELCIDHRDQDIELNYAIAQMSEATFYVLKNGKARVLHRKRRKFLDSVPVFSYTYSRKPIPLVGISLMLYADNVTRKLSLHIPWAPLIGGRIVELDGTDDKGNVVPLSNRPAKGKR